MKKILENTEKIKWAVKDLWVEEAQGYNGKIKSERYPGL